MSNITIGRYDGCTSIASDGTEAPLTEQWAGWVEGEDTAGKSWIVYLDGNGRPALYWPTRESSGAVVGEPVRL